MILARHAEAMFWIGRFLERAESTARCLDVASSSAIHLLPADAAVEWAQLVSGLGLDDDFDAEFTERDVVDSLLSSAAHPGSVVNSVQAARDNLRVVRDRVPVELWEEANRLHLWLQSVNVVDGMEADHHEVYAAIRRGCQAIGGVVSEAMQRDEGHAFIVVGRTLERSILTVGLVGTALSHPDRRFEADRLLRSTSTLQAFRRHHGDTSDPFTVAIFLICEPDVPRTIRACLNEIEDRLTMLCATASTLEVPLQLAGRVRSTIEFGQWEDQLRTDPAAALSQMHAGLIEIAEAVSAYVAPPVGSPMMHSQFVRPGGELS